MTTKTTSKTSSIIKGHRVYFASECAVIRWNPRHWVIARRNATDSGWQIPCASGGWYAANSLETLISDCRWAEGEKSLSAAMDEIADTDGAF
jgi:hypothetical protein